MFKILTEGWVSKSRGGPELPGKMTKIPAEEQFDAVSS